MVAHACIPALWEAEAGGWPEIRRRRLQGTEIVPVHSSLGHRASLHVKKKRILQCSPTFWFSSPCNVFPSESVISVCLDHHLSSWRLSLLRCLVNLCCWLISKAEVLSLVALRVLTKTNNESLNTKSMVDWIQTLKSYNGLEGRHYWIWSKKKSSERSLLEV